MAKGNRIPRKGRWPRKSLLNALRQIENTLPPLASPVVFNLDLVLDNDILLIQLPNGTAIPFPRNYFALPSSRRRNFWVHILSSILDTQPNEGTTLPLPQPASAEDKRKVGTLLLSLDRTKLDVTLKVNKKIIAHIIKI